MVPGSNSTRHTGGAASGGHSSGGEAIELERIPDQLHAGRPDYGQPRSTVGLFRIAPDGQTAVRVPVELGRAR